MFLSIFTCLFIYLSERSRDAVECDWIDTRVDEGETKARDSARVPKFIKVILRLRVEVEPQEEQVGREEANRENHDKRENHLCNLEMEVQNGI